MIKKWLIKKSNKIKSKVLHLLKAERIVSYFRISSSRLVAFKASITVLVTLKRHFVII